MPRARRSGPISSASKPRSVSLSCAVHLHAICHVPPGWSNMERQLEGLGPVLVLTALCTMIAGPQHNEAVAGSPYAKGAHKDKICSHTVMLFCAEFNGEKIVEHHMDRMGGKEQLLEQMYSAMATQRDETVNLALRSYGAPLPSLCP